MPKLNSKSVSLPEADKFKRRVAEMMRTSLLRHLRQRFQFDGPTDDSTAVSIVLPPPKLRK